MNMVSEMYMAALETMRAADQKFSAIRNDYRALRIDDATFLEAKAEYDQAEKAWEAAYQAEESIQVCRITGICK